MCVCVCLGREFSASGIDNCRADVQGHVRLGPETVTDPAFLVTRSMEDFVTWVDTSKIKRKVRRLTAIDDC